jgi:hypothetical protein
VLVKKQHKIIHLPFKGKLKASSRIVRGAPHRIIQGPRNLRPLVPLDILGPKPAMVDLLLMMMKLNFLEMIKAMKMVKART